MKKYAGIFAKGLGLGLGAGFCLAGFAGILFQAVRGGEAGFHPGNADLYFFVVGAFLGIIAGWCFSLQMILGNLLSALFLKILELVPMPVQGVGKEWAGEMGAFFREIIQPFPDFFRKFVEFFLASRFEDYGRINRALDKARKREPSQAFASRWMSLAAVHYILEPLWIFFYAAYAILFLAACVFWSFPFFK